MIFKGLLSKWTIDLGLQGGSWMAESMGQNGKTGPLYAAHMAPSQGRAQPEKGCSMRSLFQRDRDRIVHSTAFRRLTHKTQVFIYHEGDHYRTRLTHTLEVAQIARSVARMLLLDEDLTEAVALAHDLGHSPFGHAGERALNKVMQNYGGFDHNAQSLKHVTLLEHKYADFDGLNLSFECLEGIVKHNGPLDLTSAPDYIRSFNERFDLKLDQHPLLEAQVAAIADDIAYCNHDIDDGLRAGLITINDLEAVPLTGGVLEELRAKYGLLPQGRLIYELNRRLITLMVADVLAETSRQIETLSIQSQDDVRQAGGALVRFSAELNEKLVELRRFLFDSVYRDAWVMKVMGRAEGIVIDLFYHYQNCPEDMPEDWQALLQGASADARAVHICDFVAGMTDRFAVQEHRRWFDATPELR